MRASFGSLRSVGQRVSLWTQTGVLPAPLMRSVVVDKIVIGGVMDSSRFNLATPIRHGVIGLTILALTAMVSFAQAGEEPFPVATIQASASKEVLQDEVRVVMAAQVTADSAAEVNRLLSQALSEARQGLVLTDSVQLSTGRFSAFPSYDKQGKVTGWAGNASVVIDSQDLESVAAVIEHMGKTLAISSIQFSLSEPARQASEKALMQDLAEEFKVRAQLAAQAFGFKGYDVIALDFTRADMGSGPVMRMASAPMMADAGPSVSLEPSMTAVEVNVLGRIRLR